MEGVDLREVRTYLGFDVNTVLTVGLRNDLSFYDVHECRVVLKQSRVHLDICLGHLSLKNVLFIHINIALISWEKTYYRK